MSTRNAEATWNGTLKEGDGRMSFGGGAFDGAYSFSSRFEEGEGTNPEELIAAAQAGCFSMALSADLERAGHTPKSVHTKATVTLDRTDAGPTVTQIHLVTEAEVPGIGEDEFQQVVQGTKENCPISRLLKHGTSISVDATLMS